MKSERKTRKIDLQNSKLREKSIIAALITIFLTVIVMVVSYIRINQITEQRCLERMQEGVNTVIDGIGNKLASDSNALRSVAKLLELEEDFSSETMKEMMGRLSPIMTAKNLNLLLPGDLIISGEGNQFDVSDDDSISFDVESALGEHVTDRKMSVGSNPDQQTYIIRHFVPIVKNGETVAMLYMTTNLQKLPQNLNISNIYNGTASVYIIDRSNGDFIMDTWHDQLGKIDDEDRQVKGGKSWDQVVDEIKTGKQGYAVIHSNTTNEYLYFYYAPLQSDKWQLEGANGQNQWTAAVTVPEDEAFANLYKIRTVYFIIAIIEAVILISYLIWTIRNTRVICEKAVLEERLIKAENAERAKTMFLSNMSHDIRTPMNAIIGYTTLAAANIENTEKVQDYLSKILSSSNHLLSLINDVLDMSRIESGRVYIEEVECSLPDLLRDLRNILMTQMKSKQLDFYMDTIDVIDEDVYCDKLHMNQVLLNLLSNAIKFTPAGGAVSLTIKQKPGAPEGYAAYEIRVKDTGIGMSPEFVEHVFEPFEREQNSTVSGIQGTGLGMPIAKNIIDMMGGTIEVQSEQGKGTEYIVNIELRLVSERRPVGIIKELEGFHALVVDDDYTVCDSVTKMLVQLGLRAEWTMSGKEAILHARQAKELADEFRAYIIDWLLPDISGIEVVRRIRNSVGETVPIIILTAYDWTDIEEEARQAGVTAFCNKPIFLSTLRDTLLSAIGKFEQKTEEPVIPTEDKDYKGKRLLLVEDNELNREIAYEILTEGGFVVETAEDGTVAVDKVKKSTAGYYDLILMDVQMPIMNGYDATRAIRALDDPALASIPIIAMTANAFNEDKMQALECGMNDHIAKPLNMDVLNDTLHKYLGGKK